MTITHAIERLKKLFAGDVELQRKLTKLDDRPTPPLPASLAPTKAKKKRKKKPIDLAKKAIERGVASKPREYFASAIVKRAEKIRADGETVASAVTRAVTEDAKGRELFKAQKVAAGIPVEAASGFKSAAEVELDRLAREYQDAHGVSYPIAFDAIFNMPKHKSLRDAVRVDGLVRQMKGQGGIVA